jgi:hypothetical protein
VEGVKLDKYYKITLFKRIQRHECIVILIHVQNCEAAQRMNEENFDNKEPRNLFGEIAAAYLILQKSDTNEM